MQRYQCRNPKCGASFTAAPGTLKNKTYPLSTVLRSITEFNRGTPLNEIAAKIRARSGQSVAVSTIESWLADYPHLTTYRHLRAGGSKLFRPNQIIRSIKLYHRQVYEFGYHRAKLAFLKNGSLDAKRVGDPSRSSARFALLADFLESIPTTCPHELFRRDDGVRGSQLASDFLALDTLVIVEKQNAATETAGLILPTVGTNYDRHPKLQSFMLANDSTTIAIEIPIWLDEHEIAALERQHHVSIVPPIIDPATGTRRPRHITGHLDFLQARNGAIHILDYKPDARTNRPIAQLTIYALALTVRIPGLKLFDIKCAWFNENVYNEFFPRLALKRAASH